MRVRLRVTPTLIAAALVVSLGGLGAVSAQQAPVNANGDYAVASANRNPVASDSGDNVVYGDITTGNGGYTVSGDPNAVVYRSDLAGSVPTRSGSGGWVIPNTSSGMVDSLIAATATAATTSDPNAVPADDSAGVPIDQTGAVPADDSAGVPVDGSSAAPADGNGATPADESSAVPADDSAGVPIDDTTTTDASAPAWSCANYGSWYDAQNAYEAAGGVDGDPAMVDALDPDANGIACEAMME
ncbi:MAG TPA: hypothetical protein VFU81_19090 [Thermomicrobiales bacterium]|nr:hypothetical protein [Thermomicrobiales bacterium]